MPLSVAFSWGIPREIGIWTPHLMGYTQFVKRTQFTMRILKSLGIVATSLVFLLVIVISFPAVLKLNIEHERASLASTTPLAEFPVTVNPQKKLIVENTEVNAFLEGTSSPLQAAAMSSGNVFNLVFTWVATTIANAPWYQTLASANGRFVTLYPGMRREQVANAFGSTLGWTAAQKKQFLTRGSYSSLPLTEGSFPEGTYFVESGSTPLMAQALVNDRFSREVLARYGTTTAAIVPLNQALTIASLIEREAGGPDDMRIISGIIWNRLFLGMNLQIDATVQYAKASATTAHGWWPKVVSGDQRRASSYNTYLHRGLPPTPIASPSVASVIAALNPKNTSCIFYFHDDSGNFHCSDTYKEHVAALKKIYGRGR